MNPEPLLNAPPPVWLHLATVLPAFAIGIWLIFLSRKGSSPHRVLGYVYLALMTVTAIASLFVHELFGHLGPIHLLVPLTLFGVVGGLVAARRHDRRGHQRAMLSLFFGALVIAGSLTLLPGRMLNHLFFG